MASRTDLASAIADYLTHLKIERGLAEHTLEAYQSDLKRYLAFLGRQGVVLAKDVKAAHVAAFTAGLVSEGLAAASVGRMTVTVRGLHRYWWAEGVTDEDAAAEVAPRAAGIHLPKALSIDQVEALIASTGGQLPGASWRQIENWALVELLYGTGARVSELLDLDLVDANRLLQEPESALRITGKGHKTRLVPVGHYARAALEAWIVRGRPVALGENSSSQSALLIDTRGHRLGRQAAFNRVAQLGVKAQLPVAISPHTLRHSYATHLLDGGADVRVVQELLGHASVATTQIYTLVTIDHLRSVYRLAHPRAVTTS
ncbi:MAG: tyrosine recombinase [Propionibacteriaceae bacterium]|jgi:integrase/recombinase XerD|nr:tyrosine recombinase [Propionibacteriaceae bacterium]